MSYNIISFFKKRTIVSKGGQKMDDQNYNNERREHKRYKLNNNETYATLGQNRNNYGNIIDISLGGLSFSYNDSDISEKDFNENELFIDHKGIYITRLNFNIVWKRSITNENVENLHGSKLCGVKFNELTNNQIAQLSSFLISNEQICA